MNVQRYELEIYHCNGGEMLVSETGDYVSHDDYAALEAKCAALAAENAALKESEREFDKTCAEEFGSDWVSELTETPATDAFLAEVRAQGVDAAIEHLHKKFDGTGHIGVPVMALEWLAKELRQDANTAELVAAGIITKVGE